MTEYHEIMKHLFLVTVISVIVLLSGCKTKMIYIPVKNDSIVYKTKLDSFIYKQHDSIYIHSKGDTVFFEKYRTIYSDRTRVDTISVEKTKEIPVPMPPEVREVVPKWCWWLLAVCFFTLLGFGVKWIWKIKK